MRIDASRRQLDPPLREPRLALSIRQCAPGGAGYGSAQVQRPPTSESSVSGKEVEVVEGEEEVVVVAATVAATVAAATIAEEDEEEEEEEKEEKEGRCVEEKKKRASQSAASQYSQCLVRCPHKPATSPRVPFSLSLFGGKTPASSSASASLSLSLSLSLSPNLFSVLPPTHRFPTFISEKSVPRSSAGVRRADMYRRHSHCRRRRRRLGRENLFTPTVFATKNHCLRCYVSILLRLPTHVCDLIVNECGASRPRIGTTLL
jgi:hypothetical protein